MSAASGRRRRETTLGVEGGRWRGLFFASGAVLGSTLFESPSAKAVVLCPWAATSRWSVPPLHALPLRAPPCNPTTAKSFVPNSQSSTTGLDRLPRRCHPPNDDSMLAFFVCRWPNETSSAPAAPEFQP